MDRSEVRDPRTAQNIEDESEYRDPGTAQNAAVGKFWLELESMNELGKLSLKSESIRENTRVVNDELSMTHCDSLLRMGAESARLTMMHYLGLILIYGDSNFLNPNFTLTVRGLTPISP